MDKVAKALARAKGQVEAVGRMYAQKKKCLDIVQQVAAARSALGSIGRELLKEEACQCMVDQDEKKKFDKILKQLFKS